MDDPCQAGSFFPPLRLNVDRKDKEMNYSTFAAAMSLLFITACGETRYIGYQEEAKSRDMFSRQIEFKIAKDFYHDPPDCIVVLPSLSDEKGRGMGRSTVVEEALAQQLSGKVARVIGPGERDRWVRHLAVNLSRPGDRRVLAHQTRCSFYIQVQPWGGGAVNALIWSQLTVGLKLEVTRASDGHSLWVARHVGTRSSGGLSLSPLSAISNIITVSSFRADDDIPLSLISDVLRRIIVTLPDTRFTVKQ
jgi:hypothetical protein